MKTSRDVVRESFLAGYNAVKNGSINNELTPSEIEAKYPRYSARAFAEGMLDALHMDSYRYYGLIPKEVCYATGKESV